MKKWTKFGVYKQETETKLNINPVLLYGRKEMKTKTQTEYSSWNCKNSTSTSHAGLRWVGIGVGRGRKGEGQQCDELDVHSEEGSGNSIER